jgi:hypothetical protein
VVSDPGRPNEVLRKKEEILYFGELSVFAGGLEARTYCIFIQKNCF